MGGGMWVCTMVQWEEDESGAVTRSEWYAGPGDQYKAVSEIQVVVLPPLGEDIKLKYSADT